MIHKCILVKTGGKAKNVNYAKKLNFAEIRGIHTFFGNRGKFIIFLEIGGNAICITDLGRWTPMIR